MQKAHSPCGAQRTGLIGIRAEIMKTGRRSDQREETGRTSVVGVSGFTLIELTVVIGIVSILAVIGFSWLQSSIKSAYEITAQQ